MDDRVLAMCELSNDLLFQKIPRERLGYYVDRSLKAGREAARKFAGKEIRELYAEYGVKILQAGTGRKNYGVILRGQAVLDPKGCSVEVYQDSIKALAARSEWKGITLTPKQALDIHLAHEFYHIREYLEHSSIAEELDSITRFSFLGLGFTAHIQRCSEIAAHAFAKELLNLQVLPNLYDYLYLIDTGKMSSSAFDELTAQMTALLFFDDAVS